MSDLFDYSDLELSPTYTVRQPNTPAAAALLEEQRVRMRRRRRRSTDARLRQIESTRGERDTKPLGNPTELAQRLFAELTD